MSSDERDSLMMDFCKLSKPSASKCLDIIKMHEPWFEIKPGGNRVDMESYKVETLKAIRVFIDSSLSKSRYTIMFVMTYQRSWVLYLVLQYVKGKKN
jgi:hypothetical protein